MLRRLKAKAGRGPDAGAWFVVSRDTPTRIGEALFID
jgi:hypothetical protein